MLIYFQDTLPPDFPTFTSFASHIGVTREELEARRGVDPAFEKAWRACREIQKARLIEGGLAKRYDASFTKFLLSEMFGFAEEKGPDTLTVTVEVVE